MSMALTVCSVISQVLRSPKLDHLYGITLLLSVDESEALKILLSSRKTCKGYTKIMV